MVRHIEGCDKKRALDALGIEMLIEPATVEFEWKSKFGRKVRILRKVPKANP